MCFLRSKLVQAIRKAPELAGVEFIDENGGGPGVRLRNRQWNFAASRGKSCM